MLVVAYFFLLLTFSIAQTFADADADKDGKINKEEWKVFVSKNPMLLKNMTLSHLRYNDQQLLHIVFLFILL